ncbi:MAG: thioredoxin domain-containing protein [Acidobacteriota bacterium]
MIRRRSALLVLRVLCSCTILVGFTMTLTRSAGGTEGTSMPPERNHLAGSTSPYLLQHKDNPVFWYPWGEEALAAARRQQKPIFLSIGYSACHWCHVMEKESFEDPATAKIMNEYFISIKVDREERPDLDDIYMTAVQAMTGSGGWPMSVWLTPDLKPFFGGTYFPNRPAMGRPSFTQVIQSIGNAWRTDRAGILAHAEQVHQAIVGYLSGNRTPQAAAALTGDLIGKAVTDLSTRFDAAEGGFGPAPKFPPHRALSLLLAKYRASHDEKLSRMFTLTFDKMERGGMYDQVGGGFHRYSTDARWLVPHFEKMLYDNALMAEAYIDAWRTTGRARYEQVAREIFAWLEREMTDPHGAFYSSLDADSDGEEGKFYVWRPDEVIAVLGPDEGALVNDYYGITATGNFEGGRSIPHVEQPPAEFAASRKIPLDEFLARLDSARAKLLAARGKRVPPLRDDKILSAWNGLMIAALAEGSAAFHEPRYGKMASQAADFILKTMRRPDGLLRVSYRKGQVNDQSFLDDQAFFLEGLLALYESTSSPHWLQQARELLKATDAAFWDPVGHAYYFTPPDRKDLLVRVKKPMDGAIPSGNSVTAGVLVSMYRATGEPAFLEQAGKLLSSFSGAMSTMPGGFHNMLASLDEFLSSGGHELARGPIIRVTAAPPSVAIAPGGRAELDVQLEIREGWHVNSSKPTMDYLIPTTVSVDFDRDASVGRIDYPQAEMVKLEFMREPISVYRGSQRIHVVVTAPEKAPPGPLTASCFVSYQACNDESCLKPARVPFDCSFSIQRSGAASGSH